MLAIVLAGARSIASTALPAARWGMAMVRGARRRNRRALDRPQSGDRQDRGLRPVGGVHGPGRRDLRAAADVRRAGFVSVLAVDPVPARGHRRRRRLDASARWSARRHRRAARAPVEPRRIPAAVFRRAAAGGAVGRAGGRDRHAGASVAHAGDPAMAAATAFDVGAFLIARRCTPAHSRCATSASPSAASRRRPTSASPRRPARSRA